MTARESVETDGGMIISGARSISRARLYRRAASAARGFARLGVAEGDAVALILRNDIPFLEASIAAATIGAYAVPINWHFTAEEAGYVLRDCGARVVVVHADLLRRVAAGIPDGTTVLVVPTPPEIRAAYDIAPECGVAPAGLRQWDAFLAEHPPWTEPPRPARVSMIYTSGTTGRPKGVRREPASPEEAQRMTAALSRVFGIEPGRGARTVVTGPMYHTAPNRYALLAVRDNGLVVLQPRFDAEELLALIERHRITHLHMVPTMFVRLLRLPEKVRRRYDLSSLEFVIHAAAPCPPEVKRRMIEWWGKVINEYYGATETGAVTFLTSEEALHRPGTVGRPVPGATIRIYGGDGRILPAGEIGEVYCRLDAYPDFTYHGRPEDRAAIERDGLVTCGDMGYLDEDGYLYICDRRADMVISGGVNIYPAEIEAALLAMPGVRDCAVFGIPDEEFGEALCACVEPDPGATPSEKDVAAWLRGRLAGYKVPRRIDFVTELPREDSGKVFKRKLRERYWRGAGRKI